MWRKSLQVVGFIFLFRSPLAFSQSVEEVPVPNSGTENPSPSKRVVIKVRAKGNGKFLGRAEIKIGEQLAVSDPKGEIILFLSASTTGSATLSRAGFDPIEVSLSELYKSDALDIFMIPATPDDNEVVIKGARRQEASRKNVTVQESVRVAQGGDPVQVTKLLPGVQTQTFGTDIVVRGSAPEDSRYFIDSFEVPDIFHRIGNISVLPDQITSDVEFSTGGFGAQYGNATGGVINLRTKSELPERPKTEIRVELPTFSSFFYERPVGEKSSFAVSFRKSYIEYILPKVLPKDQGLTVVPYFSDAHIFVQHKVDDGYYKVFAMNSGDGLKLVFPADASTSEDGRANVNLFSGFCVLGVERLKTLNDGWSYSLSPEVGHQKFNLSFLDNSLQWKGYFFTANSEWRKRRSKNESTYLGFQPYYSWLDAKVLAPVPTSDPYVDNEEAPKEQSKNRYVFFDFAAWAAHDLELGNFVFTPGLRAFYNSQIDRSGVDPRFNARLRLTEVHSLKAATGMYSRSPEVVEASKEFGNENLDFEKSLHYVLGLESNWSPKWTTDFQLFVKRGFDSIAPSARSRYENTGSLQSKGIEVFVRRNMTERFFGWFAYTYSKTESRNNDRDEWRPSQYDQTQVLNLAGSYRLTATWDLGTRLKFHTGDTYTSVDDAVYNAGLDKYQPRQGDTKSNNRRLPDYQQLDLFATKDFLANTWKMSLRFGVQYLAYSPQAYSVSNNYDYSKEEYLSGLPPIPFVELRGEF